MASEPKLKMIFKYGSGMQSELNTFQGTYTKDMVADSPITVKLSLSESDLDKIYKKMIEINFFSYPEEFSIFVPPKPDEKVMRGRMVGGVSSYYFKVEYNSIVKELRWTDDVIEDDLKKDERASRLRELIKLIEDIIESKEEYKKIPAPRGGYL